MRDGFSYSRALIVIFICTGFFSCTNTPIADYVPKDRAEAGVLAILIRYEKARKNFDIAGYLGCLHDRGIFHHAGRIMVSKQRLSELLPDFWNRLQDGNRLFFPMCRENLSGNYFVQFNLINPQITIDGNTASVVVTYINTGWRLKHYISLRKGNNQWLIDRLDWDSG